MIRTDVLSMTNNTLRLDTTYRSANKCGAYRRKDPVVLDSTPHWMCDSFTDEPPKLRLLGRRLLNATTVTIGDIQATPPELKVLNDCEIEVQLPRWPKRRLSTNESYQIIVGRADGAEGVSKVLFTFVPTPWINEFTRPPPIVVPQKYVNKELPTWVDKRGDLTWIALKAVVITVMNEAGGILDTVIAPNDKFSHSEAILRSVFKFRLQSAVKEFIEKKNITANVLFVMPQQRVYTDNSTKQTKQYRTIQLYITMKCVSY
jgi:hypothetical protein